MGVIVLNTIKNPTIVNDIVHENIHDKNFFDFQKTFIDVLNNGYVRISLRPQTKEMHLIITVETEGKCYFKSYIDTTWTDDGTLESTFNRYINDSPAADAQIYSQGTVDTLGTQRFDKLIPGGTGFFSTGATSSSRVETVLDSGLELTLEVQNVSNTSDDIGITVEWYEV